MLPSNIERFFAFVARGFLPDDSQPAPPPPQAVASPQASVVRITSPRACLPMGWKDPGRNSRAGRMEADRLRDLQRSTPDQADEPGPENGNGR